MFVVHCTQVYFYWKGKYVSRFKVYVPFTIFRKYKYATNLLWIKVCKYKFEFRYGLKNVNISKENIVFIHNYIS